MPVGLQGLGVADGQIVWVCWVSFVRAWLAKLLPVACLIHSVYFSQFSLKPGSCPNMLLHDARTRAHTHSSGTCMHFHQHEQARACVCKPPLIAGMLWLQSYSTNSLHHLAPTLAGLVILDDFPMSTWMGVAEALAHFTNAQDRLVPFLTGWNKVWLTTASHVDAYEDYVRSKPDVFACRNLHASKLAMGGRVTCYTGPSNY